MATGASVAGSGPHPRESMTSFWGCVFYSGREPPLPRNQWAGTGEARAEPTNPVMFPFARDTEQSPNLPTGWTLFYLEKGLLAT